MDVASQIRSSLESQAFPVPSQGWLITIIPNRDTLPPLPSLVATAKARFLAANITDPAVLDASAGSFPENISRSDVKEFKLPYDIVAQVLDIENLSKSRWEQVEDLEAIERGEQTRGREIVRLPPSSSGEDGFEDPDRNLMPPPPNVRGALRTTAAASVASKNATHRLVLQDRKGKNVYGLELKHVEKIGLGSTNIGEKILLKKGSTVARGVILLEPATCTVLGGKIEAWQKAWLDGRLTRLKEVTGTAT